MSTTITARPLTLNDVHEGLPVYVRLGAGHIPGAITAVTRHERKRTERVSGPVVETGTEVRYEVRTDTGVITSGAFHPRWMYNAGDDGAPPRVRRPDPARVVIADDDGPVQVEVPDVLGAHGTVGFYLPGAEPGEAEQRVRDALTAAGITVWAEPSAQPVTEQRVTVASYDGEYVAVGALEARTGHLPGRGCGQVTYLPFDAVVGDDA